MKKQKNKITKDIQDVLIATAKMMPVMYKTDLHGNPLYKRGEIDGSQVTADKNGLPGVAGVKYLGNVLQYENHLDNLIKAYQLEAWPGVRYYEQTMAEIHQSRLNFVKNTINHEQQKKSWRARILSKVKSLFGK